MSVPADRMAARNPVGPMKDPNKIMGLPKPAFYAIIVVGLFLAYYIYKRSQNSAANAAAGTAPTDSTQGLTAADIGGTPADNSFATNTDLTSIEEQIQQLQDSLFQLQQSNGGNGAGLPGGGDPSKSPGGGLTTTPITFPISTPGTGTNTRPIDQGFGTPGGNPIGNPVTLPVGTNAPNDLNLVAAGITPRPSGGQGAVPY